LGKEHFVNFGGWLLLTALFGLLLFLIQRSERKRRIATAILVLGMSVVIWRYAMYRMGGACDGVTWQTLCSSPIVTQHEQSIAIITTNWAIVGAIVGNFLFWALIGRYNLVGSSDSIKVYGLDMEE
jgi:uncharacterized membrane protein YwaF